VSDQEVLMFMKMCESQKLNPFNRDVYLIKYGNLPASMVVGKDAFAKRADSNPAYKGSKSGIIVINLSKEIEYREGTFYLKEREELVGGWARVSFKDGKEDLFNTVSLDEYIGRKKDGTVNSQWAGKPATMIKKVALVQALRDAFPNNLGQMYVREEMNIDEDLPTDPIDPVNEQMKREKVEEPPKPANKLTKQQVMQIAAEKGLMTGEGKSADVSKLEEFCNKNGMSLRGLTEEQALNLIEMLRNYVDTKESEIQDAEFKEKPNNKEVSNAEDNSNVEDDIKQEEQNTQEDEESEEDPF
jgi:phage recombination protein Bet